MDPCLSCSHPGGLTRSFKLLRKSHCKELTLPQVADMFRDEDAALDWVALQRWPEGPHGPKCRSANVQFWIKQKTMIHRCRDCTTGRGKSKTMFSIKTDKVMEGANLKYRAVAFGLRSQFSPIYREVCLPVDWPPPSPKKPFRLRPTPENHLSPGVLGVTSARR